MAVSRSMKKNNLLAIAKFVSDGVNVSNSDIAAGLRMSMPTVLQHVKYLQEQGVIIEKGKFESNGGRKASVLSIAEDIAYAIGLDIKRDTIIFTLVNMCREILMTQKFDVPFENSLRYFEIIGAYLQKFIEQTQILSKKMIGVGISLPGIVDAKRKLLLRSHALNVKNVSLQGLERVIGYPIKIENDANCAAYAELRSYCKNAVYLSLNDTVGGAIFLKGELYRGEGFKSGEFGHMVIERNGRTCYCGKKGCIDTYCSAKVLKATAENDLSLFFDKLTKEDPVAVAVWKDYSDSLALIVANLRMAFDCDIVLGGEVGGYLEQYYTRLVDLTVKYNSFEDDIDYLRIGRYKYEASSYGASLQFVSEFFKTMIS